MLLVFVLILPLFSSTLYVLFSFQNCDQRFSISLKLYSGKIAVSNITSRIKNGEYIKRYIDGFWENNVYYYACILDYHGSDYKEGKYVETISGYTFNQMIWYLLLAEVITFGSGSSVATDEIRNCIKSGNIAYQVVKPYNYIIYSLLAHFVRSFNYSIIRACY